jgi:hypothetical protein
MARQNHNANYLFDVDGETVWEKLRVIRGLLIDKQLALKVFELTEEENSNLDITTTKYKKYIIYKEFNEGLKQDLINEIKFLEEFESYLAVEAEKTRIDGKTDDEMYEINFFHEMEVRLVRKAQAQIASSGRIGEELMLRLMKNKPALKICVQQGLLNVDIENFINTPLLPSADVHTTAFLENKEVNQND